METGYPADRKISGRPRTILVGSLIDGNGSPAKKNILMTIEEGRIVGMRPFRPGAPPGDLWLDLSGCTVLPPLIDCHVHLTFSGSHGRMQVATPRSHDFESLEPVIFKHIQCHLQHGVLGIRDGGDPMGNTLRYKHTVLAVTDSGIRLNAAGTAWHREGRYGKLIGRAVPAGKDPVEVIKSEAGAGGDHIKLIQSGLNSLEEFGRQTQPQFDQDTIEKIYTFARKRGVGLMIHANGETPVAAAIAGGCDSIEHGYFMGDENLRKMADARIAWVPTCVPMKAYVDQSPRGSMESDVARKTLDHQLEQLSKARTFGVPVALGTDSGSPGVLHGKAVWEELQLMVSAGYTPEEAIQCATLNAARMMKTDLVGCLAVGMPATFIALKGEIPGPLEAGGIDMMMVGGRVLKEDSA